MALDWLEGELRRLSDLDLLRGRRTVRPLADNRCEVDGQRCRNFASNDYLNLASDSRVLDAAQRALSEGGAGATASALICGRTIWHERLEQTLAEFEQTDAAVLFPTGFAANLGAIAALASSADVVFCDRLNHASLVDGCRLSDAKFRVYRHDRLDVLERELRKARTEADSSPAGGSQTNDGKQATRLWIVTDSVFSMDGDLAPLPELCDLAERFNAELIVDEAHATGVFGVNGRGVCELSGTESRVAVRIGTLSKAVGCLGGFVACSPTLREWLWNSARTQMFSTALPPSVCAAATQSLLIIREEPQRRARLLALSQRLVDRLRSRGLAVPASVAGPIVPVPVGDAQATVTAAAQLLDAGFLVGAIRPPTVPHQTSRLRVCVSAAFEESDIDDLAEAIGCCVVE
ncbi:aminotransferase class I/II-fold pyridoxal phosphate-dependent enzyme [bacterium]|nr:aminotransferase class I/II-fold pyridoxal phosphate-dependent enzyme [bacterium]